MELEPGPPAPGWNSAAWFAHLQCGYFGYDPRLKAYDYPAPSVDSFGTRLRIQRLPHYARALSFHRPFLARSAKWYGRWAPSAVLT
jgi:hypothetical protein